MQLPHGKKGNHKTWRDMTSEVTESSCFISWEKKVIVKNTVT